ncbi:MAG: T9SS type A sorting domain-containing protein [Chitinophagaceae bacterium]|nr:T9SS type A sorting domain-containing protein [Chitinophagaceae bacterium]
MKHIFSTLLFLTLLMPTVFAQGDYRNDVHIYATQQRVNAADFEAHPNHMAIAGTYPPLSYSIGAITNPMNAQRIFLTDYITGNFNFRKAALITGVDVSTINTGYRYTVSEIKFDGNYYVICGNIICTLPASPFNDAFVLKVNTAGMYQWFYRYKIPSSSSVFFHSIEPVKTGTMTTSYLACGYRIDSLAIRRAIVMRIDSSGTVMTYAKQLNEPWVSGKPVNSEYRKVVFYSNTDYALTGYCNQAPDGCGKSLQSDVIFSMYNLPNNTITGKAIGTGAFNNFNQRADDGISLVKIDTGLVILSKYYNAFGLNCATQPDHISNLIRVNPVVPTNSGTWLLMKSLKFNTLSGTGSNDVPKDLLYESTSGANRHLWVYGNHVANKGYLIKINFNTATNLMTPKLMNNHVGNPLIDGKTIDFNTAGRVVGLTNLNSTAYSLFEITYTPNQGCQSDSNLFPYVQDTLSWINRVHDSLVAYQVLMPHTIYNIPINQNIICDTVVAKPSGLSGIDGSSDGLLIYPNPTTGMASVQFDAQTSGEYHLMLYDLAGHLVHQQQGKYQSGINEWPIDLRRAASGLYMIYFECNGTKRYLKLMKE